MNPPGAVPPKPTGLIRGIGLGTVLMMYLLGFLAACAANTVLLFLAIFGVIGDGAVIEIPFFGGVVAAVGPFVALLGGLALSISLVTVWLFHVPAMMLVVAIRHHTGTVKTPIAELVAGAALAAALYRLFHRHDTGFWADLLLWVSVGSGAFIGWLLFFLSRRRQRYLRAVKHGSG